MPAAKHPTRIQALRERSQACAYHRRRGPRGYSARGARCPGGAGCRLAPAIEQFGEGIFIRFDEKAIRKWLQRDATKQRQEKLIAGYGHWGGRFSGKPPPYPGTAYVLLHSLSHALMAEIALDCGYPASSLKERVYALPGPDGGPERCGILIYTATAGAQGTLGGLVGTTPRLAQILGGALERSTICSNDPICADHEPDDRSGDRATHGAACHGCLLIAETSCEMRNLFLDRNLLVPTMAPDGAAFFGP
jgi:MrfA Zn-binding domain